MPQHSRNSHDELVRKLDHAHEHLLEIKAAQERDHKLLLKFARKVNAMANELDRIESEVTDISGAVDSAVALLDKLAQLIRDNAGDPARLNKIADDIDAKGNALAAAVVANDPDAPTEPAP